jgi:predicted enzyme related to lactoylglutathione lyase
MPCPLVWFEAVGQHADKLHSFYGEVLGWRFDPDRTARAAAGSRPPAANLRIVGRAAAPTEPPWWVSFYTRVADLEAAIETARSLGGRVLVAPTQHGDARIAVVSDPEGHPVGLCC